MRQDGASRRVIGIGLDSAEFELVTRWAEAGYLPNIRRVMRAGTVGELRGVRGYTAETPWTTCLTGCRPETTGYWSCIKYTPDYQVREIDAYDYEGCGLFYSYCRGRKVIALDVPHVRPSRDIDGIQVIAWGAHSPLGKGESVPPELYDEIVAQYGPHPALNHDDMLVPETDRKRQALENDLVTGIERRTRICLDFMRSRPWDLLLVVFGEPHSAGHHFWHLSQEEHPLYGVYATPGDDPMLNVYKAVDTAVGEILSAAPDDARIVLFSPEGMKANSSDLPSWLFLPELLYRASFDGRVGLAGSPADSPLAPISCHKDREWMRSVWELRADNNPIRRLARSHLRLRLSQHVENLLGSGPGPDHPLSFNGLRYMPSVWYKNRWPEMKAFALPTFSDGYVRINLRGREANGMVDPADYDRTCEEVIKLISELRDARSKEPVVSEIVRVRGKDERPNEHLPDADLIVLWTETPTDAVEHPVYGRIGPVPFRRTGDHRPRGFFAATGPDIPVQRLPMGDIVDIAPTILNLLGVPIPNHFDGQPRLAAGSA